MRRLININRHEAGHAIVRRQSVAGGDGEARSMKAGWTIFWLAAIIFAVAFGAAWLLVPDVVPVGYADEPRPSCAVLTAFLLRAIELTAAWVAAIAFVVMFGVWARDRMRRLPS
jgi:hypothetical protein